MTPEQFRYEGRHRAFPTQNKRWCDERLADLIGRIIRRICARRSIPCIEVFSAKSCTFVRVQWPSEDFQRNLPDAINVAVTRRARREVRWPLNERVFSKHPSAITLDPIYESTMLRDAVPGLSTL
jgi:hypothetical protein